MPGEPRSPSTAWSALIAFLWCSLGLFVGYFAGQLTLGLIEGVGVVLFPGLWEEDSDLAIWTALYVALAWGVGSCVGAFVAVLIAGKWPTSIVFALSGLFIASAFVTASVFQIPASMAVATYIVVVPCAWLGGLAARRCWKRRGPKPYDMRERNMAC